MGFPRIISKNNKVYTKLGEFCLSNDGNNFFLICHTCQEELQTQDHFWKHIQDEHNFTHSLKQEVSNNRTTTTYIEAETSASPAQMPLPLYRKLHASVESETDHRDLTEHEDSESQQHGSHEAKDYTDMRTTIDPAAVEIDIKVEPVASANSQTIQTLTTTTTAAQAVQQIHAGHTTTIAGQIYQLPQVPATYATIMHTPATLQALSGGATVTAGTTVLAQQHIQELQQVPKDSNSTTASAGSGISSDDGERWYVCDHCGLKFKYQSRLELHRAVHSKERKFACEICGASFKQSCNLSTHRKKKHFLKGARSSTAGTTILLQADAQQQQQEQAQQQQLQQQQQQRF